MSLLHVCALVFVAVGTKEFVRALVALDTAATFAGFMWRPFLGGVSFGLGVILFALAQDAR